MRRVIALFIIILVMALGLWLKDYIIPSTWTYRITVEIETPEGIKSGSAVREVRAWNNLAKYINPDVRYITYRVIGEAVVIDLGEKGILFDLNHWDSNSTISNVFPRPKNSQLGVAEYYRQLEVGTRAVQTGGKSFVWLDGFENETVLQRLDSADFDKMLGDGFKFKQTTIEITDEAVTWSISPLLAKINSGGRWGNYYRQLFEFK